MLSALVGMDDVVTPVITTATTEAGGYVTAAVPLILGVAMLWVALKYGKRIVGKI